jgi:tripartite-type tricarboxylate transporter receptor subunit TctC
MTISHETPDRPIAATLARSTSRLFAALASGIASALVVGAGAAQAQSPEQFYKGKNVTLLIPFDVGSGYDTYARAVARHIGKHIPGNPNIVPSNMLGGGGLVLSNHLYHVAPKDGSVFALMSRSNNAEPLLGNPAARFDPRNFSWIGNIAPEVSICAAWHTAGFSSWQDITKKEFIATSSGASADNNVYPLLFNALLGTRFKVVIGYKGGASMNKAIESGEAHGRCGWSWTSIKATQYDWVTDKKIVLLMQAALKKSPDLPNVPLAIDLAKTPSDRKALEFLFSPQAIAWALAGPPTMPADRLAAMRKAFTDTMKDKEFLADAKKLKLDIDPMSAEEVIAVINAMYAAPPESIAKIRNVMKPEKK